MSADVPEQVTAEREALIAEIHRGFQTVKRAGISWNECVAIDNLLSDDECAEARRSDKGTHWSQLVDDPEWVPFPGIGGFSFIDEAGFRYYLPPTMIRFLRGEDSEWYPGHFLSVIERFVGITRGFWSTEQLRCVARFVEFMSRHDVDVECRAPWAEGLERRWKEHLGS